MLTQTEIQEKLPELREIMTVEGYLQFMKDHGYSMDEMRELINEEHSALQRELKILQNPDLVEALQKKILDELRHYVKTKKKENSDEDNKQD